MKLLVGMLLAITLTGCMAPTMNEARQEGPYKTLITRKVDKDVAQCIQYEWQNQSLFGNISDAYLQPARDGGFTVYTVGHEYFVDVKGTDSKTEVKYYVAGKTWIAKKRLEGLASCL